MSSYLFRDRLYFEIDHRNLTYLNESASQVLTSVSRTSRIGEGSIVASVTSRLGAAI